MFVFDEPRKLSACPCGYAPCGYNIFDNKLAEPCPLRGLLNHSNFPSFRDLPDANDLDTRYYAEDHDETGIWCPVRHWCLVGEIHDVTCFVRPRASIRTKFGENVQVHFYLESGEGKPPFFDWSELKPGHTMCILYPYIHNFMDMTRGIRQEDPHTVIVFPADFTTLKNTCEALVVAETIQQCAYCHVVERANSRCGRCKIVRYCSTDCQKADWRSGHRALCPHIATLQELMRLDFGTWKSHFDWTFTNIPDRPIEERRKATHELMEEHIPRMCPGATLTPVRKLLSAIGEHKICDDTVLRDSIPTSYFEETAIFAADSFPNKPVYIKQMPGFNFLDGFCRLQPRSHVHVVDFKDESSNSDKTDRSDFWLSMLLESFLMSLPLWHKQECPDVDIAWLLECHSMGVFFPYCVSIPRVGSQAH